MVKDLLIRIGILALIIGPFAAVGIAQELSWKRRQ